MKSYALYSYELACKKCGESFHSRAPNKHYCLTCETKTCPVCGEGFRSKTKTCSTVCGNRLAGQMRSGPRPEYWREAVRQGQARSREQKPQMWERVRNQHSIRMQNNNPSRRPDFAEKMKSTKLERGVLNIWPARRGGNGQLTRPQKKLACALAAEMEYPVRTVDGPVNGFPHAYKVDIALPWLMLAIEIDGKGHRHPDQVVKDNKKDKKLTELGWTVLRFTNEDVTTNVSWVLSVIETYSEGT